MGDGLVDAPSGCFLRLRRDGLTQFSRRGLTFPHAAGSLTLYFRRRREAGARGAPATLLTLAGGATHFDLRANGTTLDVVQRINGEAPRSFIRATLLDSFVRGLWPAGRAHSLATGVGRV